MVAIVDTEQTEISELVAGVKERKIALPEFQREFVWDPDDVAALLVSIARGWPIGTFLLLKGDEVKNFEAKPVEGIPEVDFTRLETLVLDGQQRLTGLYHAFEGLSDYEYYLEIGKVQQNQKIDDEDIKSLRKTQFPNPAEQAQRRIIPIQSIVDDQRFFDWIQRLPEGDRDGWLNTRNEMLPGLRSYRIPSVILSKDVPLEAIAKIFVTINDTGQNLTTFDLMVARLFPHKFNLRDRWSKACELYPVTMTDEDTAPKKDRSDRVNGLDVLKLIALWETLRRSGAGNAPAGVRESDVLKLRPEVVIENWDWAAASLDRAFRFAQEHCGVARWNLLPAKSMLYPLADALSKGDPDAKWEAQLKRWYWGVAVNSLYAWATATRPVTDADALRAWATDETKVPEFINMPSKAVFHEQLREPRPRKVFQRAIACLICALSAEDWLTKNRLIETDQPIELHHVFPTKYNDNHSLGAANVAANLTPIFGSTNKSLRNDPPHQVAEDKRVARGSIETHLIDFEAYARGDYEAFLNARINSIFEAFRNKVDGITEEEDEALARAIAEGLKGERVSKEQIIEVLRDPDGA